MLLGLDFICLQRLRQRLLHLYHHKRPQRTGKLRL